MVTLSLADTETVVLAAFNQYTVQNSNSFVIAVGGHNVNVNITLRANSFDCGTPGYDMDNVDVPQLRGWVPGNITMHGDVGALTGCKNVGQVGQVNVLLREATDFNFHVNLTGPCA